MARKKISQTDARRYRKERDEARDALRAYTTRGTYQSPGTHLGGLLSVNEITMARLRTARSLGYGVFTTPNQGDNRLDFYAVKPGEY